MSQYIKGKIFKFTYYCTVSDNEINDIAGRLETEMGGWIFHRKIDWNNPTPSVMIESVTHPEVIQDWLGEN